MGGRDGSAGPVRRGFDAAEMETPNVVPRAGRPVPGDLRSCDRFRAGLGSMCFGAG